MNMTNFCYIHGTILGSCYMYAKDAQLQHNIHKDLLLHCTVYVHGYHSLYFYLLYFHAHLHFAPDFVSYISFTVYLENTFIIVAVYQLQL